MQVETKTTLNNFKQELKALGKAIRETKEAFKEKQRSNTSTYRDEMDLHSMRRDFRHRHVAYCLFRGRSLAQVDSGQGLSKALVQYYQDSISPNPYLGKLYCIARKDLSKSQQGIQAGHAMAEFILRHPETHWDNGILVYLKASKEELESLLQELGSRATPFYEEDLGGELTAIAALGIPRQASSFQLM